MVPYISLEVSNTLKLYMFCLISLTDVDYVANVSNFPTSRYLQTNSFPLKPIVHKSTSFKSQLSTFRISQIPNNFLKGKE